MDIIVKVGKTRIVLLIPILCIVIKLPIIHPSWVVKEIIRTLEFGVKNGNLSDIKFFMSHMRPAVTQALLAGIKTNWLEWLFYKKSGTKILVPTWFSFFGLFNIQPLLSNCPLKRDDLWYWVFEKLNCKNAWSDHHHFSNPDNFSVDTGGYLRIRDYGSYKTQLVINEYGYHIWKHSSGFLKR